MALFRCLGFYFRACVTWLWVLGNYFPSPQYSKLLELWPCAFLKGWTLVLHSLLQPPALCKAHRMALDGMTSVPFQLGHPYLKMITLCIVMCPHACLCIMYMPDARGGQRWSWIPWTGVTDSCEPPHRSGNRTRVLWRNSSSCSNC